MIAAAEASLSDSKAVEEFNEAWNRGSPFPIEALLPPPDDPRYLPTLMAMCSDELEWSCKIPRPGQDKCIPTAVEEYLNRFPVLRGMDHTRRLLIAECAARLCYARDRVSSAQRLRERFPALFDSDERAEELLNQAANEADAPPVLRDYEILGELGRGGMGVVYKARDVNLDRVVALKMILAGGHAGQAALARFRMEAESIARLHHPNIIHIFEVGKHGESPFLALEFCGGGSLDKKLAGAPLPPKEAGALAATLARAVQAAHDKGVVHRDLKPANVLFTEDGTPKISDFGLARWLEGGSGQTQTGDVLGTPSYMAPEQAKGQREVGPAADVYALGAILYECLTRRPPFKAATAAETIHQVLTEDPAAPRSLSRETPKDLESICLKCLEKGPKSRYATAKELADDLERFLAGRPVRARPIGWAGRTVKWCRRNPTAFTIIVSMLVLIILLGVGGYRLWKELGRTEEQEDCKVTTSFRP